MSRGQGIRLVVDPLPPFLRARGSYALLTISVNLIGKERNRKFPNRCRLSPGIVDVETSAGLWENA
jgi:hypothetical protein